MRTMIALAAASCFLLGTSGLTLARGVDDPPGNAGADNPGRPNAPKPQLTLTVLEFQTMVGVDGPFLGGANPIRGISGGGLPWVLDSAKGELKDDGKLEVEVMGLVIPETDAPLPCGGAACNPAPYFKAVVSCLTVVDGMVEADTISTANGSEVMIGDPKNGDAKIEAMLDLPDPCVAPIVFVTNPGGAWFAVTGVGVIEGD